MKYNFDIEIKTADIFRKKIKKFHGFVTVYKDCPIGWQEKHPDVQNYHSETILINDKGKAWVVVGGFGYRGNREWVEIEN